MVRAETCNADLIFACIFVSETEDNMTSYVLLAVIITFLFVLILVPVVVVIVVQTKERDVRKKGQ